MDRKQKCVKKGRLEIHPLFLLLGVYYSFSGELLVFLIGTLVALQHECAHAYAAERLGYRLNRVILMPYGAVIDGDLKGISIKDEIIVASAGPIANMITALFFFALWWIYPPSYPFTDIACYSSLSIVFVNLIPAYPLDGGRVLKLFLENNLGEKKSKIICFILSIFFATLLFILFVLFKVLLNKINIGLLIFSIFIYIGVFGSKNKNVEYERLNFSLLQAFRRGVEIKRMAVYKECTIKKAIGFLEKGKYLIMDVYDASEKKITEISQDKLYNLFLEKGLYDHIYDNNE